MDTSSSQGIRQTDLSKTDDRQTLGAEANNVHVAGSCLSCSQESNNCWGRGCQVRTVVHQKDTFLQAPVQKVDNIIQWTNHYPLDSTIAFPNTYPLYSDLFSG